MPNVSEPGRNDNGPASSAPASVAPASVAPPPWVPPPASSVPGGDAPAAPAPGPTPISWDAVLLEISRARSGWAEALEANNQTHRIGHERLRMDLQGLTTRVETNYRYFDDMNTINRSKISTLEAQAATPIDATKLVLSTRAIIAVVMAAVTIAASYWNLSTKLDAQEKLRDLQIATMQKAIEQTTKSYELLRLDLQALQQSVITGGKPKQP